MSYVYPDSVKYGRRHFDAGAAAYLDGATLLDATAAAGMESKTTLRRFLAMNALLRPPGAGPALCRATWRQRRADRLAVIRRFPGRPTREIAHVLGISERSVYRVKKYGLAPAPHNFHSLRSR